MRKALVGIAVAVALLALGGLAAMWMSDDDGRREGALTLATLQLATGPSMVSPDGSHRLEVRNDGIFMTGPGGSVKLTPNGVTVDSNVNVLVKGAGTVKVQGSGATTVQGALVNLNCTSGGPGVARVGDIVNAVGAPGPIVQGSTTVSAC